MNNVEQHYDRLTGDERFRLAIAAFARGDDSEVSALARTCPKHNYQMSDWEFSQRMDASQMMLVLLRLELESSLSVVRFIDTQDAVAGTGLDLLEKMHGAVWMSGYDAAGGDRKDLELSSDDPTAEPTELEKNALSAAIDALEVTRRLRLLWQCKRERDIQAAANILGAFDAFSQSRWGMDGSIAMKAHGDLFSDVEYLDEIAEAATDGDAVKGLRVSFDQMWQRLMHQGEIAGNTYD